MQYRKRMIRKGTALLLSALLLASAMPFAVSAEEVSAQTTEYVNFRTGPGTNYSSKGVIPSGTGITVTDTSNSEWYAVRLSDGSTGYIYAEYISVSGLEGLQEVLAEMKKLRDCGKTVVMITHDVEEAVLADQVILMGCPNGQKNPNTVLAQGSVREILTDSRLLIQAGIVPPMAVRMYEDLKLAGIELNRCPLTKEELAEALCRWKSEN